MSRERKQEMARERERYFGEMPGRLELARERERYFDEMPRRQDMAREREHYFDEIPRTQDREEREHYFEEIAREREHELAIERDREFAGERDREFAREKEYELVREREYELAREREYELVREREYELAREREYELAREREYELAREREYELAREREHGLAREKEHCFVEMLGRLELGRERQMDRGEYCFEEMPRGRGISRIEEMPRARGISRIEEMPRGRGISRIEEMPRGRGISRIEQIPQDDHFPADTLATTMAHGKRQRNLRLCEFDKHPVETSFSADYPGDRPFIADDPVDRTFMAEHPFDRPFVNEYPFDRPFVDEPFDRPFVDEHSFDRPFVDEHPFDRPFMGKCPLERSFMAEHSCERPFVKRNPPKRSVIVKKTFRKPFTTKKAFEKPMHAMKFVKRSLDKPLAGKKPSEKVIAGEKLLKNAAGTESMKLLIDDGSCPQQKRWLAAQGDKYRWWANDRRRLQNNVQTLTDCRSTLTHKTPLLPTPALLPTPQMEDSSEERFADSDRNMAKEKRNQPNNVKLSIESSVNGQSTRHRPMLNKNAPLSSTVGEFSSSNSQICRPLKIEDTKRSETNSDSKIKEQKAKCYGIQKQDRVNDSKALKQKINSSDSRKQKLKNSCEKNIQKENTNSDVSIVQKQERSCGDSSIKKQDFTNDSKLPKLRNGCELKDNRHSDANIIQKQDKTSKDNIFKKEDCFEVPKLKITCDDDEENTNSDASIIQKQDTVCVDSIIQKPDETSNSISQKQYKKSDTSTMQNYKPDQNERLSKQVTDAKMEIGFEKKNVLVSESISSESSRNVSSGHNIVLDDNEDIYEKQNIEVEIGFDTDKDIRCLSEEQNENNNQVFSLKSTIHTENSSNGDHAGVELTKSLLTVVKRKENMTKDFQINVENYSTNKNKQSANQSICPNAIKESRYNDMANLEINEDKTKNAQFRVRDHTKHQKIKTDKKGNFDDDRTKSKSAIEASTERWKSKDGSWFPSCSYYDNYSTSSRKKLKDDSYYTTITTGSNTNNSSTSLSSRSKSKDDSLFTSYSYHDNYPTSSSRPKIQDDSSSTSGSYRDDSPTSISRRKMSNDDSWFRSGSCDYASTSCSRLKSHTSSSSRFKDEYSRKYSSKERRDTSSKRSSRHYESRDYHSPQIFDYNHGLSRWEYDPADKNKPNYISHKVDSRKSRYRTHHSASSSPRSDPNRHSYRSSARTKRSKEDKYSASQQHSRLVSSKDADQRYPLSWCSETTPFNKSENLKIQLINQAESAGSDGDVDVSRRVNLETSSDKDKEDIVPDSELVITVSNISVDDDESPSESTVTVDAEPSSWTKEVCFVSKESESSNESEDATKLDCPGSVCEKHKNIKLSCNIKKSPCKTSIGLVNVNEDTTELHCPPDEEQTAIKLACNISDKPMPKSCKKSAYKSSSIVLVKSINEDATKLDCPDYKDGKEIKLSFNMSDHQVPKNDKESPCKSSAAGRMSDIIKDATKLHHPSHLFDNHKQSPPFSDIAVQQLPTKYSKTCKTSAVDLASGMQHLHMDKKVDSSHTDPSVFPPSNDVDMFQSLKSDPDCNATKKPDICKDQETDFEKTKDLTITYGNSAKLTTKTKLISDRGKGVNSATKLSTIAKQSQQITDQTFVIDDLKGATQNSDKSIQSDIQQSCLKQMGDDGCAKTVSDVMAQDGISVNISVQSPSQMSGNEDSSLRTGPFASVNQSASSPESNKSTLSSDSVNNTDRAKTIPLVCKTNDDIEQTSSIDTTDNESLIGSDDDQEARLQNTFPCETKDNFEEKCSVNVSEDNIPAFDVSQILQDISFSCEDEDGLEKRSTDADETKTLAEIHQFNDIDNSLEAKFATDVTIDSDVKEIQHVLRSENTKSTSSSSVADIGTDINRKDYTSSLDVCSNIPSSFATECRLSVEDIPLPSQSPDNKVAGMDSRKVKPDLPPAAEMNLPEKFEEMVIRRRSRDPRLFGKIYKSLNIPVSRQSKNPVDLLGGNVSQNAVAITDAGNQNNLIEVVLDPVKTIVAPPRTKFIPNILKSTKIKMTSSTKNKISNKIACNPNLPATSVLQVSTNSVMKTPSSVNMGENLITENLSQMDLSIDSLSPVSSVSASPGESPVQSKDIPAEKDALLASVLSVARNIDVLILKYSEQIKAKEMEQQKSKALSESKTDVEPIEETNKNNPKLSKHLMSDSMQNVLSVSSLVSHSSELKSTSLSSSSVKVLKPLTVPSSSEQKIPSIITKSVKTPYPKLSMNSIPILVSKTMIPSPLHVPKSQAGKNICVSNLKEVPLVPIATEDSLTSSVSSSSNLLVSNIGDNSPNLIRNTVPQGNHAKCDSPQSVDLLTNKDKCVVEEGGVIGKSGQLDNDASTSCQESIPVLETCTKDVDPKQDDVESVLHKHVPPVSKSPIDAQKPVPSNVAPIPQPDTQKYVPSNVTSPSSSYDAQKHVASTSSLEKQKFVPFNITSSLPYEYQKHVPFNVTSTSALDVQKNYSSGFTPTTQLDTQAFVHSKISSTSHKDAPKHKDCNLTSSSKLSHTSISKGFPLMGSTIRNVEKHNNVQRVQEQKSHNVASEFTTDGHTRKRRLSDDPKSNIPHSTLGLSSNKKLETDIPMNTPKDVQLHKRYPPNVITKSRQSSSSHNSSIPFVSHVEKHSMGFDEPVMSSFKSMFQELPRLDSTSSASTAASSAPGSSKTMFQEVSIQGSPSASIASIGAPGSSKTMFQELSRHDSTSSASTAVTAATGAPASSKTMFQELSRSCSTSSASTAVTAATGAPASSKTMFQELSRSCSTSSASTAATGAPGSSKTMFQELSRSCSTSSASTAVTAATGAPASSKAMFQELSRSCSTSSASTAVTAATGAPASSKTMFQELSKSCSTSSASTAATGAPASSKTMFQELSRSCSISSASTAVTAATGAPGSSKTMFQKFSRPSSISSAFSAVTHTSSTPGSSKTMFQELFRSGSSTSTAVTQGPASINWLQSMIAHRSAHTNTVQHYPLHSKQNNPLDPSVISSKHSNSVKSLKSFHSCSSERNGSSLSVGLTKRHHFVDSAWDPNTPEPSIDVANSIHKTDKKLQPKLAYRKKKVTDKPVACNECSATTVSSESSGSMSPSGSKHSAQQPQAKNSVEQLDPKGHVVQSESKCKSNHSTVHSVAKNELQIASKHSSVSSTSKHSSVSSASKTSDVELKLKHTMPSVAKISEVKLKSKHSSSKSCDDKLESKPVEESTTEFTLSDEVWFIADEHLPELTTSDNHQNVSKQLDASTTPSTTTTTSGQTTTSSKYLTRFDDEDTDYSPFDVESDEDSIDEFLSETPLILRLEQKCNRGSPSTPDRTLESSQLSDSDSLDLDIPALPFRHSKPTATSKSGYSLDFLLQEKIEKEEENRELGIMKLELKEGIKKGGFAKLTFDSDDVKEGDLLPEYQQKLHHFKVSKSVIVDVHPGEEVFCVDRLQQLFTETISPQSCGFTPSTSTIDRHLATIQPALVCDLVNTNTLSLCFHVIHCKDAILRWLFFLMSVHSSSVLLHGCKKVLFDILHAQHCSDTSSTWTPDILDIMRVFLNYGAKTEDLMRGQTVFTQEQIKQAEEVIHDENVPQNAPNNNPHQRINQENISMIIQTISCSLQGRPTYSAKELSCLLVMIFKISLDTSLKNSALDYDLQVCVASILENYSSNEWPEMVPDLCLTLSRITRHHHNKVFMAQLLPSGKRGRYLQRRLSYVFLQQMLFSSESVKDKRELQNLQVKMLSSVFRFICDLASYDLYALASAITLLDMSVGNECLKSSEKADLDYLTGQLKFLMSDVRDNVRMLDKTRVKDMMVRVSSKWTLMMHSMTGHKQKSLFAWAKESSRTMLVERLETGQDTEVSDQTDEDDDDAGPLDHRESWQDDVGPVDHRESRQNEVGSMDHRESRQDDVERFTCDNSSGLDTAKVKTVVVDVVVERTAVVNDTSHDDVTMFSDEDSDEDLPDPKI